MARKVVSKIENGRTVTLEPSTPAQKAAFKDMLESRRPPSLHNDDTRLFHNQLNPFPNMPESLRQHYLKQARAMGIEPNGKVYKGGLVREEYKGRFDPEALVDSTHDVKKIIEQRGWSCEGMVNVSGPDVDVPEELPTYIADDLVEEHAASEAVAMGAETMSVKEFKSLKEKTRARLEGAKD